MRKEMLRVVLYLAFVPISIWALDSINITNLFKKNRYYQARILYLLVAISMSYLVVNFFMDFYIGTAI